MSSLEYRSILGHSLAQPIATLFGDLLHLPRPLTSRPGDLQDESGYSCSVVLLCVAALEDFAGRYFVHVYGGLSKGFSAPAFLKHELPQIYDSAHMPEVFAVRNGIAHAHQWALRVGAGPENVDQILDRSLPADFGNRAFRRVVDLTAGKTRKLGLNAVPMHITRDDALSVLGASLAIVRGLQEKSSGLLGFDSIQVNFDGINVTFLYLDRHIEACGPTRR